MKRIPRKHRQNVSRVPKCLTILALGGASFTASAHPPIGETSDDSGFLYRIPNSYASRFKGILSGLDVLGRSEDGQSLVVKGATALHGALIGLGGRPDTFEVYQFESKQGIDGYIKPNELNTRLARIASDQPKYFRIEEIGRSRENQPILAMIIGASQSKEKPSVFFNGMHHARELMTTEVTLSIIEAFASVAKNPDLDPEIAGWLEDYRVIVVPQMNPDGGSLVHSGRRMWRKNTWRENNNIIGVDLNRNYPAGWGSCAGSSGNKNSDTYRGPEPASEPESRALMNLVSRHKPTLAISYHAFSEMIIFPYGCQNVENPSRDLFENIANSMNQEITNDRGQRGAYALGTAPELLYNADGSDIDWQWEAHGVLAYTIELNSSRQGFQPDYKTWRNVTIENQIGGWKSMIRRLDGSRLTGRIALDGEWAMDRRLSYSVSLITEEGKIKPFAPLQHGENKRFTMATEQGMAYFHRILGPGEYRIEFFSGDRSIGSRVLEVSDSPLSIEQLDL